MKACLLTVLLLGSALVARAQEYYLDLHRQHLAVAGRTVAVEQVVDGRRGNLSIGYVYRGLANDRARTIFFRRNIGAELTEFIQAQLPAQPTDHPVVLCLRRLYLREERDPPNPEIAEAYLSLDAYLHQPDGYHFVQSVGSHISHGSLEATALHAGHVARLLSYCLGQLSQADWALAATQPARTLAQLPADVPVPLPSRAEREPLPPILSERPRRGIYQRFDQFLANRPDTSRGFRLDTVQPQLRSYLAWQQWQRVPWVRPLVRDGRDKLVVPAGIWGFSDGHTLFVQQENHYFPLMPQGRFFTTVGTAPIDKFYAGNQAANQARARYTTALEDGLEPSVSDVPVGYALDMHSGKLHFYPGLSAPTRPDTAYVYVYRPAQAAGPAQVQVWLNGKPAGTLRPGEYLQMPWPYYATLASLCLTDGAQGSACQHLIPDVARPNFLRLTFTAEAPLWQWVPAGQGEADLNELTKRRETNR